jgi:hypothetical protein
MEEINSKIKSPKNKDELYSLESGVWGGKL